MSAIEIMHYQGGLNEGQITSTWEVRKTVDFSRANTKRQFDM